MAVAIRSAIWGVITATICLFSAAADEAVPNYRLGDIAKDDVKAPFKLVVSNPEETQTLREKEALRVPAVFRFDPSDASAIESEFLADLTNKRKEFCDRLEAMFDRRSLKPLQLSTPRYQRLAGNFIRQNKQSPLTTNLLELWAQDASDEPIRAALLGKLHSAAARFTRTDVLPPDFKLGPLAKVVSVKDATTRLSEETVLRDGVLTHRTNIVPLAKARLDLIKSFSTNEQRIARILASSLRVNCVLDQALTETLRSKRTAPLWVEDHYEAGQLLLKKGQTVDRKSYAALNQLRESLKLQQQATVTQTTTRQNQWLLVSVTALSSILLFVTFLFVRRKRPGTALPLQLTRRNADDLLIACPSCEERIIVPLPTMHPATTESTLESWKQRALSAEARAEAASNIARRGMVSQLARVLKEKLVTGLVRERAKFIQTNEAAQTSVAALEARLREVNAPLQERLAAYQNRIIELERELTVRGEENRELIKAKIHLAKTKAEISEAKGQMDLN